jgi:molybdopterin synthase catalytic subunit
VKASSAGGIVSFIGTVRDRSDGRRVSSMELEAAAGLARADLTRLASEAARRFKVSRISIVHRVGKLRVGDIIVAIAVSAPHRSDAFNACRFLIDGLKKTTPIWKKEFSGRKGHWVEEER